MKGRYQVQERLKGWGLSGQKRLGKASAAVVGIGALGGHCAGLLARAGVGRLILIDPDRVSIENLHRQVLYNERDAAKKRLKVEAAARELSRANSRVEIITLPEKLTTENAKRLLNGAGLVLDGLDSPAPRYVLNRACHDQGIPFVHAGVAAMNGQILTIRPGRTPCLRCWGPEPPESGQSRTVAKDGVMGPLPGVMASLQAAEALKILLGHEERCLGGMLCVNLIDMSFVNLAPPSPKGGCPVCAGEFTS